MNSKKGSDGSKSSSQLWNFAYSGESEGFCFSCYLKHVNAGSEAPCILYECFCVGFGWDTLGQVLVGYWKQSVGFFCSCPGCRTAFDVHTPAFLEVPSGTRLGTCTHARERASYFLGQILLTTLRRLISEKARTKGSCLSPVKQLLVLFFLSVRWARIPPHIHQGFF